MILVTGAAGFIGANVVAALLQQGREVTAADVLNSQHPTPYLDELGLPAQHRVDRDALPAWLEDRTARQVQAIVHLGACSDTTVSDRDFVMRNNFEYSQVLWKWCARRGLPLVYASSAATYGDGSAGYDDEAAPGRLRPLNLYGESKHRFDLWALEQAAAPPRWAGLKYFNVYGPREEHKGRMASVALHVCDQIQASGEARLFQSHRDDIPHGGQKRDFIFVADAVAATLHFLATPAGPAVPNGLYNVGTGQARTFEDLARAVFAALGLPPRLRYVPMPEDLRGKYQYFTQASTAKLRRAGFSTPLHSLEEGVKKYVEWLQSRRPPRN